MSTTMLALIGVLAIAVLHLAAGYLQRENKVPPAWLTAASGMSVAYVFVHLLPELGQEQTEWLQELPNRPLPWLESQVYIATFFGVILALVFDRGLHWQKRRFRVRMGSYSIYNVLIGCFALHVRSPLVLLLAVVAFGAHFLLHDRSLYIEFGPRFDYPGRWIAAASIIAGWLLATVWQPPAIATAGVLGIVSGGIITRTIQEELPSRHEERFTPWLAGAIGYTALILMLDYAEFR